MYKMNLQKKLFVFVLLHIVIVSSTIIPESVKFKSPNNLDFPCKHPQFSSYPFCNTSLSIKLRSLSLVSSLTLDEKIGQLSNTAAAVPRLGIPPYEWWSESLHGIAANGPGVSFNGTVSTATSFPQVIVSAASFNRSLWFKIGSAVAVEARAMYNVGQAGLTFWAPNINIFRDPRWGRGQETPGEDPMVVSEYSVEFVRGFQGRSKRGGAAEIYDDVDDDGRIMLSACCKHFTAYDLEKWGNSTRYDFNAVVTEQDMEDTYQPPFRSCIQEGKASCLMCSYNAVNGVPACARGDLIKKARDEWGFQGYITSDCDAVATIFEYQKYTKSAEDAVADAIKAGVDINCGSYMLRHMKSAIELGEVSEEHLDKALFNLFLVQLRLGLFDGNPRNGRYGELGPRNVCTSDHKKLALEAARQGIVLLKNEKMFLPLDKTSISSLAIIGPMANDASNMGGGYTGTPCDPKTLFEEFQAYIKKTSYAAGCLNVSCDSDSGFSEAVAVAKQADVVIVVAGLDLSQETEDHDRTSLGLPGKQRNLVTSVAAVSKRPVVLVLTGGGPLDVSFADVDSCVASILWIGYPGETGGQALAEIVFGEYNPAGRLPLTWYPESFTKVPMTDMRMRPDPSHGYPGRTYRFYTGPHVYRFGHGLSYTNFTYKFISAPSKLSLFRSLSAASSKKLLEHVSRTRNVPGFVRADDVKDFCDPSRFSVRVSVTNIGQLDGGEVVMMFSRPPMPRVLNGSPEKQLIGFERVHVTANGTAETVFVIDPCKHLGFADEMGKRVIPLGVHVLAVGELEHYVSVEA